ncbi:MAG TPA: glutamate-1-semialdehyde 2,1-aminomutase [Gaiellaceae bacterium]|nr:glutamate-1-semialdehyde 2,1-aminomutase [Gaiellaceae bacterium]
MKRSSSVAGRSAALYERALALIPGGVNSPVRAMRAVGLEAPLFVRSGEGAHVEDADGSRYVDWVLSWGPLVFGHADGETVEAVTRAAQAGTTFGASTEAELELAAEIVDAVPSVEKVRLVSSGTEAAMSALRLARAATGRDLVLKFAGCYHGHVDALLAAAGSGPATLGIPATPGVPANVAAATILCPYNDVEAVQTAFARHGEELACVLVEPVAGNMGVVSPAPGFLEALRVLCDEWGALLVFDEVITGFRVARGGAQERFGVRPDLTLLGKIVGGGLPAAALGGRADVMDLLAPLGEVYQAGTLAGNPLATAAGASVLRRLRDPRVYEELERRGELLEKGLREAADEGQACVQRVGAMATLFMRTGPVRDFAEAAASDVHRYGELFRHLLEHGVYIPPSQFEAMFVSVAHGEAEIDATVEAVGEFFQGERESREPDLG